MIIRDLDAVLALDEAEVHGWTVWFMRLDQAVAFAEKATPHGVSGERLACLLQEIDKAAGGTVFFQIGRENSRVLYAHVELDHDPGSVILGAMAGRYGCDEFDRYDWSMWPGRGTYRLWWD